MASPLSTTNSLGLNLPTSLQTIYPAQEYRKYFQYIQARKKNTPGNTIDPSIQEKVQQHSAKYQLVHKASNQAIVKCAQSHSQINTPGLSEYKFTLLHLAVLLKRTSLIKPLIGLGADVARTDSNGWNPLHHAAVISDELVQEILKNTSPSLHNQTTPLGGTYEDLTYLSGRKTMTQQVYLIERFVKPIGRTQTPSATRTEKVSADQMATFLNRKEIIECPIYQGEFLFSLWNTRISKTIGAQDLFDQFAREILTKPRKLICSQDSNLTPDVQNAFKKAIGRLPIVVKAGEDLPFGVPIGLYAGEVVKNPPTKSFFEHLETTNRDCYRFSISKWDENADIDGFNKSNVLAMADWGFPNMFVADVNFLHGTALTPVFFCAEKNGIKEGTELLWNYGGGETALAWGRFALKGREAMTQFIKNHPDLAKALNDLYNEQVTNKNISEQLKHKNTAPQTKIQQQNLLNTVLKNIAKQDRLCFLAQVPAAAMYLICMKFVSVDQYHTFLTGFVKLFGQNHSIQTMRMIELVNMFKILETHIKDQKLLKEIHNFILDLLDTQKITSVVYGVQLINNYLSGNRSQIWQAKKQGILELVQRYQPNEKNFPLKTCSNGPVAIKAEDCCIS